MPLPFIIIIGVILLVFVIAFAFKKKKGSDTPESLERYFSMLVGTMNTMPPFNIIFKKHSNDGNQIIYKEITNSRDCYFRFERYKIILDCYSKTGEQVFYAEHTEKVFGGMKESDFITIVHNLYVNKLHKGKVTI